MSTPQLPLWPDCPAQLSHEQRAAFKDQGFLAFNNVFTPEEVDTSRQHISDLIARVAADPTAREALTGNGRSLSLADGPFGVQFERDCDIHELQGDALELKVRKLMWYCGVDEFFGHQSAHHPKIQTILAALLGPQPVMFQDMALIKPPQIGSIKPWHQDNAYFSLLPLDAVIGVWIALDPATVDNGCMHVIPGGHKAGARRHYHDRDCEIIPDRIDPATAIPIEFDPGGALFFCGMLPHQTPANTSPHRRRALQWHYHSATATRVSQDAFDRVFAEADGTPASCLAASQRDQAKP